jgi:integrase
MLKDGIPEPEVLKEAMKKFINKNHEFEEVGVVAKPTLFSLTERFINGEIKFRGRNKSESSLKNYHAVTKHLKEYQEYSKKSLDFEDIDLNFFYVYTSFLEKKGLGVNTIAKDISIIKVFMGEAVDLGYTNNMIFRHKKFIYSEKETEQIYLTEAELDKIYKVQISSKKLDRVRDLFLVGAWTGLRYSDFSNIRPEHIVKIDDDYCIKMMTKKTGELVIIPCNPVILDIFNKYKPTGNLLPRAISNQNFNNYIKEVCVLASLTEKGRLSTRPKEPLAELVSSHTARRSFATNHYLQGFPTIDLMKITGHKSERSFLKYIRVSKLDTARRFNEHIKKKWGERVF